MSFDEWSNNKKKKKYNSFDEWSNAKYGKTQTVYQDDEDDIAPVKGGNKDSVFKSGGFSDGVDGVGDFFVDLGQTVAGTAGDLGLSILKGAGRMVEGVSDLALYGVSGLSSIMGDDKTSQFTKKIAKRSLTDEMTQDAVDYVDQYSILGNKADMVGEGLGQVGAIILTGGIAGAAGIGSAGATALTTGVTGLSGWGSGMSEAYASGATDSEAVTYGLIAGVAEAATELMFGGLGKASKAIGVGKSAIPVDDVLAKKVSSVFSSQIAKNIAEYGIKAGAEGTEEVVSGILQAVGKKATYLSEKELGDIIEDENLLEQFVVGAVTSGIAQSGVVPGMKRGSLIEANKNRTDFITGYTQSDQYVLEKEVENRVAEKEKNGNKLTKKEVSKIEEQVKNDLEKGYISIDTIEKTLGGETYNSYKNALDENEALKNELEELSNMESGKMTWNQQKRLQELESMNLSDTTNIDKLRNDLNNTLSDSLKNSRLMESYNEKERRTQKFEADLTKYKGKQREAVERAIQSGVLNNTNRSHDLVDILSKIEAEKGIVFNYTDNKNLKESGFSLEGKTVNGYVQNGSVTLNVQSQKAWQSVVGHEITHVLEGTESYNELRNALYEYAESKGELESRRADLTELYKNIDSDIESELTADLVGDYLFTDSDFIKHITGNRNVFQKIYDEIKYLCKVATGKELTEIERVKKEFDKVWKEFSSENIVNSDDKGVNYSVSETNDGRFVAVVDRDILSNIDTTSWDNSKKAVAKEEATSALKQFKNGIVVNGISLKVNRTSRKEYTRSFYTENLYKNEPDVFADKMRAADIADDIVVATTNWNMDGGLKHSRNDSFVDFERGTTLIMSGTNKYTAEVLVGITKNGESVLYDVVDIKPTEFEIKEEETSTTATTQDAIGSINEISSSEILTQTQNNVNTKSEKNTQFSLSNNVEETKDLIAVHNISESKLLKSLKLGGLPMPSIAIIRAKDGHGDFGDISLVFGKETIDPQFLRSNKVYSGDAYTPTYPRVEYKINDKAASEVHKKINELLSGTDYEKAFGYLALDKDNMEDYLNRSGGDVYDAYGRKDALKLAFLKDNGKEIELPKKEKSLSSRFDNDVIVQFANKYGSDKIHDMQNYDNTSKVDMHIDEIKEIVEKYYSEKVGRDMQWKISRNDVYDVIDGAARYLRNGITKETDTYSSRGIIDEAVNENDYKEWLIDLFSGVIEKEGLRNNRDTFTPSGNRRSFDALHYEHNLENVIKAMKEDGEKGLGGFGRGNIFGASTTSFSSIDDIRNSKDRLQNMTQEEYDEIRHGYSDRFFELASSLPKDKSSFIATDDAANMLIDAVIKCKTKSGMESYLRSESKGWANYSENIVDDLINLVNDIRKMPTRYFEAKPRRVVGFDEVATAIIPDNASESLKKMLTDNGVNFVEYESGNEQSRLQLLNTLENSKFSLSYENEQPSTVGTPLQDLYYDNDIAPTKETISQTENVNKNNQEPFPDEIAPMTEEEANTVQDEKVKADNTKPNEPIAQVLTEAPKPEKKKGRLISKIRSNFIDKGSAVEDLSLKTKNRALQDKYKAIGRSEAKAQYFMENGANGVKSLNDIRQEVEQSGRVKEFFTYLYHKHNVDRMSLESNEAPNLVRLTDKMNEYKLLGLQENQLRAIAMENVSKDNPKRAELVQTVREYLASQEIKNKPVFGDSVTAEVSQGMVQQFEKQYPQFKEYANDVYSYMNHLRNMMVENGIISQETAKLWAEMYPNYVPIGRVGKNGLDVNVPLDTNRTGVNAPIKGATGGNSDILPLFDTMAQRTLQTFKAIDKNNFGVELKNTLGSTFETAKTNLDDVIDTIDTPDGLLQEGKNGKNPTFTVFEDGKRVTFDITDDLYDSMKPTSEGLAYTNKALNKASSLHKKVLTEYNLFFSARNAIKDAQDVLINSQHSAKTYANFPQAMKEIITGKGEYVQEYFANGGKQNTYFDKETNSFSEEKSTFRKVVGFPLDGISKINEVVEAIPRLAEYIASRKSGATIDAAMLDAARVTTDFSAGGDVSKFLNRNGATFLNASIQGATQAVRNIREAKANGFKGVMKLAAKTAVAGIPALLFNSLMWDDDDEYEELSDYVKDNYYVIAKYGDGQFVRIPKGRAVSVIQELFEQIGKTASGEETDWGNVFTLAASNLAPNNPLDNNVIAPIIQAATNKTWYGEDLVPARLQDVPASEQYDETIDSISKWLGENTGISPYKINYVLNQYTGFIGDMFIPALTPEAERGNDSFGGNLIAPFTDQFTVDSTIKNQNTSDFFSKSDDLQVNANSQYATDEDILMSKYMNAVSKEMSDLYNQKREIQNLPLADSAKYAQVRSVQNQINELAKKGLNTYNNVNIDNGYATVGDKHFKKNDDGVWEKISDEQFEKQEKVTSTLGITPSDYWSNKEEYTYAYEYPERYAIAKSVGGYESFKTYSKELSAIESDKDEYGKSISGSRKEKVIDYINNLDADYYSKIILYKMEYTSDDSYNEEIINYIIGREDLTQDEMISIFNKLGFTVSNGYVYWD